LTTTKLAKDAKEQPKTKSRYLAKAQSPQRNFHLPLVTDLLSLAHVDDFSSVMLSEGAPRRSRNISASFQRLAGEIRPRSLDKLGMTAMRSAQAGMQRTLARLNR
jgi:hypothetical protein